MKLFGFYITRTDFEGEVVGAHVHANTLEIHLEQAESEGCRLEKENAARRVDIQRQIEITKAAGGRIIELEKEVADLNTKATRELRAYEYALSALQNIANAATPKANGTVRRLCRMAEEDRSICNDLFHGRENSGSLEDFLAPGPDPKTAGAYCYQGA